MNCLRCRKSACEGSSFCESCLKTVAQELTPSPYLNTQINLKAKRIARPASPVLSLEKNEPAPSSHGGLVFAVVLLSVLCLALAAGCLWLSRELWLPYFG